MTGTTRTHPWSATNTRFAGEVSGSPRASSAGRARMVGTIRICGNGAAENMDGYSGRTLGRDRVRRPKPVMQFKRCRSKRHSHARSAVQFD